MQITSKLPPTPTMRDFARDSTAKIERERFLAKFCAQAAAGDIFADDENRILTRDGRLVTLNSTSGSITIADVALPRTQGTSLIGASFVALEVAPATPVTATKGVWLSEKTDDAVLQAQPATVTPHGQVPEIHPRIRSTSFDLPLWGLAFRGGAQLMTDADYDLLGMASVRLGMALGLRREIEASSTIMAAGTYPGANVAAVSSTKWNGLTPARLADVYARYGASPLECATLVISEAAEPFFFSAEVQNFVQSGGRMPRVIVGRARQKTGTAISYVWGNSTAANAALVTLPASAKGTSSFRTFQATNRDDVPEDRIVDGVAMRIEHIRDSGTSGATYVVASVAEKVVSVAAADGCGGLITGVLA